MSRVGEQAYNKQGCLMTILQYFDTANITIKFESGYVVTGKRYTRFKSGSVEDALHPSNCNIGYMGDGYHSKSTNPKAYSRWSDMIKRVYSDYSSKKSPSYIVCSVDTEWHNFQNFTKWFEENYIEGWDLDKDILVKHNKVYSPETCAFVPREINSLFPKCDMSRGEYPIGVSFSKERNKYSACCNRGDKQRYIGYFTTPESAFCAYKEVKESYIKEIAEKWRGKIDERVYQAMYNYQVEITD